MRLLTVAAKNLFVIGLRMIMIKQTSYYGPEPKHPTISVTFINFFTF